jgi:hypothetical protein
MASPSPMDRLPTPTTNLPRLANGSTHPEDRPDVARKQPKSLGYAHVGGCRRCRTTDFEYRGATSATSASFVTSAGAADIGPATSGGLCRVIGDFQMDDVDLVSPGRREQGAENARAGARKAHARARRNLGEGKKSHPILRGRDLSSEFLSRIRDLTGDLGFGKDLRLSLSLIGWTVARRSAGWHRLLRNPFPSQKVDQP